MQRYLPKFDLTINSVMLKKILFFAIMASSHATYAQKIDSIYVHLYTDSLKKGTYNYINIDGKLSNGRYLPLDTTDIIFSSNEGKFYGNSLYIPADFAKDKVNIKAVLKSNPSMYKQFDIYIKTIPDPVKLKTMDEILHEGNGARKRKGKR